MGFARVAVSRLMSRGVLSAGWNSILTGSAFLLVAYLLFSVSGDAAAPFVAIVFAVTGVWQLGRGVLGELRRSRRSAHERS